MAEDYNPVVLVIRSEVIFLLFHDEICFDVHLGKLGFSYVLSLDFAIDHFGGKNLGHYWSILVILGSPFKDSEEVVVEICGFGDKKIVGLLLVVFSSGVDADVDLLVGIYFLEGRYFRGDCWTD